MPYQAPCFVNLEKAESRGVLGYCDTSESSANVSVLNYLLYEELTT